MKDTADLSMGRLADGTIDTSMTDCLLTQEEHTRVATKLTDMMISVCDHCHERLGHLLSASTSDKDKFPQVEKSPNEVTSNKLTDNQNDKSSSWLSERASNAQVCQLANMVEDFTETCEKLCGKQCTRLRSAFKAQASKYIQYFHNERKLKLTQVLETEKWRQTAIPMEIQSLVTQIYENKRMPIDNCKKDVDDQNTNEFIYVGEEKYAIVQAVLILVQMIQEYCRYYNLSFLRLKIKLKKDIV